MRDLLTAHIRANEIRMARSTYNGVFLLVEGEADSRFYGRLVVREKCRVIPVHNKDKATETLTILDGDGFVGVLAIVDADFDQLEGNLISSPNLFLTDTHDLETLLLKSPALEKLLLEMGSQYKQAEYVRNEGRDIREALLEEGCSIGYLRWASLKHQYSLKFEGLNYRHFTDDSTIKVNLTKLIDTVKNHSQKPQISRDQLQRQINEIKDESHDRWQVCCGHDLISLLSIGLHKAFGSKNWNEVEPEILERSLRLAYESIWFQSTRLHAAITEWEQINPPFQVFVFDEAGR
ncbi:MAG: DUF4435 domain-containing protein [Blastocatellia bacterium]|nr:DUF4435 domain-containing protein [Blastocatellia bacterium]